MVAAFLQVKLFHLPPPPQKNLKGFAGKNATLWRKANDVFLFKNKKRKKFFPNSYRKR
jgi:hypothetical protein